MENLQMETRHFPLNLFFKAILTRISYPSNYLTFPLDFFSPEAINSPRHTPDREKTHFSKIFFLPSYSLHFFFSLPNTKKTPKNTLKNKSKSLDSSLFAKNTRYCFCTQSSFPWFYIWIWGLGVWM